MFPSSVPLSDFDYSVASLSKLPRVSMASYNICSLMAKFDDVACLLEKSKLDILCLNETFLNPSVPDSWLEIGGNTLFRNDEVLTSPKAMVGV